MTPTPKMRSVAAGGAVATLVAFTAGLLGVEIPGGVEAAIATLVAFGLGWFTDDDPGEHAA